MWRLLLFDILADRILGRQLMPTGAQQRDMRRFVGARRFVYNKALALQEERRERGEKRLGYAWL